MSKIRLTKITEPDAPAAGKVVLYVDTDDGHIKSKDESSSVVDLTQGGDFTTASGYLQGQIDSLDDTYATDAEVVTVSGYLQGQLGGASVDSVNSLSGAVLVTGTQNVTTQTAGSTITITGPDLSSYATSAEVDSDVSAVSGTLSAEIDSDITTHTADASAHHARYTDSEAVSALETITSELAASGVANQNLTTTTSGFLQNQLDTFDPGTTSNALVGSDGITVISGSPTDTIQGFRTEFVSASGNLQTQITTYSDHGNLSGLSDDDHGAIYPGINQTESISGQWDFSTGLTVSGNPVSTGTGVGGGLNNVVEDTTPQLGGNLDVNNFYITGTSIVLSGTGVDIKTQGENLNFETTFQDDINFTSGSGMVFSADTTMQAYAGKLLDFFSDDEVSFGGQNFINHYSLSGDIAIQTPNGFIWLNADTTVTGTNYETGGNISAQSATIETGTFSNSLTISGVPVSTGTGGGGLSNVVEDTSPQLGGNLDAQSHNITSVGTLQATTVTGTTGQFGGNVSAQSGSFSNYLTVSGVPVDLGRNITYFFTADTLTSPLSTWAEPFNAALIAPPTNAPRMNGRAFDDTTEEGTGWAVFIPTWATIMDLTLVHGAYTAPGATRTVEVYFARGLAAVEGESNGWSSIGSLGVISPRTDVGATRTIFSNSLSTLSLTAGKYYIMEIIRHLPPSSGTSLSGDWMVYIVEVKFR